MSKLYPNFTFHTFFSLLQQHFSAKHDNNPNNSSNHFSKVRSSNFIIIIIIIIIIITKVLISVTHCKIDAARALYIIGLNISIGRYNCDDLGKQSCELRTPVLSL